MKTARDYIIFPLDVPSVDAARDFVRLLSNHVGMFKVGLELFVRSGPDLVRWILESGTAGVFLDLKFHDIPATVSRAMAGVAGLGATFATVHCGENPAMLKAAVEGGNGKVGVLGVTVLTSVSGQDITAAGFCPEYGIDLSSLVMKRAEMAKAAGCIGIVCSGQEVSTVKQRCGRDFIAVTPGIRPLWDGVSADDQARITTPAQAVLNGSDYIVIGRPIRNAKDPQTAAKRIADEIAKAVGG
ncbi:MAG: orotidine-5'-phosphate decarboxylase [Deltaproteobacteria bacterium]|nr:orotidine-5'-phosphate decarboxylase [Deltaproteobacteria bacterium]